MPGFDTVDGDELREWLANVRERETTELLAVGIAYEEGIPVSDLADWYGRSSDEVRSWIDELESQPLIVPIAAREGVDFDALAEASGLNRETIIDWFGSFDSRPIDEAASIVRRYSRREPGPLLSGTESRIRYLNYEVIEDRGWSIDDDDLFEKASRTDLDPTDYGRFLAEPGETILEAAENRGLSWPYACRGGACANCAVIVLEGDVAMPGQTVLTDDQVRLSNARLTCVGVPATEEVKLVMNVQHLDQFEELRLPSPTSDSTP